MATWTDGPAYAPLERPFGFATPETSPLETAQPTPAVTPGAIPPPSLLYPAKDAIPLEKVSAQRPSNRDPRAAFQVNGGFDSEPNTSRDPLQPFSIASSSFGASAPPPWVSPPPPSSPPAVTTSHWPPPASHTGATWPAPAGARPIQSMSSASYPTQYTHASPATPDQSNAKLLSRLAIAAFALGTFASGRSLLMLFVGSLILVPSRSTRRMGAWGLGASAVFLLLFARGFPGIESLGVLACLLMAILSLVKWPR